MTEEEVEIQHMMDVFLPRVVMAMYRKDSPLLLVRVTHHVAKAYRWSYKDGRGIRRLTGWTLGLVPYLTLLTVLTFGAVLEIFVMWLILPKGELDERLPEDW